MNHDYECTVCGKGFNYDTGVGHNNCEPEFCSDDCYTDHYASQIDAAMDRLKEDNIARWESM